MCIGANHELYELIIVIIIVIEVTVVYITFTLSRQDCPQLKMNNIDVPVENPGSNMVLSYWGQISGH